MPRRPLYAPGTAKDSCFHRAGEPEKPEIEKALRSATQERSKRTAITQDYVLSGIVEVVERCRQVAPVLDRSGEQILVETPTGELAPAFEFDAKNVLKGLELLGKHLNLFAEKDALDIELKRLEVEKRKAEIKRLQDGGGDDGLTRSG
nr:terminase small subunit [Pseudomonas asiatica]